MLGKELSLSHGSWLGQDYLEVSDISVFKPMLGSKWLEDSQQEMHTCLLPEVTPHRSSLKCNKVKEELGFIIQSKNSREEPVRENVKDQESPQFGITSQISLNITEAVSTM
jgi:hypothetical protein